MCALQVGVGDLNHNKDMLELGVQSAWGEGHFLCGI